MRKNPLDIEGPMKFSVRKEVARLQNDKLHYLLDFQWSVSKSALVVVVAILELQRLTGGDGGGLSGCFVAMAAKWYLASS